MVIETLGEDTAAQEEAPLVVLLHDVVQSGASVGFLPPLGAEEAVTYYKLLT